MGAVAIRFAPIVLAVALLLGGSAPSEAQSTQPVSVIVFPGGFNWPIWVAQERGDFAKGGIEVQLTNTPNSVFQLTGLIEGRFDLGMTAIDNVIAYQEGQGEAPVATPPDLFAFMGGDNGLLSLVVLPEVKSFQDLKGRTLSVDAMTTGYAFVLFDLLQRNGLATGDYRVEKAGGVLARWEALRERKQDGTMLLAPFDVVAKAAGFTVLQRAIDIYGHYQGLVGAARRGWARDNGDKVTAFIRGYLAGLEWLYDLAHRDEAIDLLRRHLPQMSPEVAAQSYAILINQRICAEGRDRHRGRSQGARAAQPVWRAAQGTDGSGAVLRSDILRGGVTVAADVDRGAGVDGTITGPWRCNFNRIGWSTAC